MARTRPWKKALLITHKSEIQGPHVGLTKGTFQFLCSLGFKAEYYFRDETKTLRSRLL